MNPWKVQDIDAPDDEASVVQATAAAGSVVLINAALLHGASANRSGRRRRVLHIYYTGRDGRQHTDPKQYLSAATKAALPPQSRRVLRLD